MKHETASATDLSSGPLCPAPHTAYDHALPLSWPANTSCADATHAHDRLAFGADSIPAIGPDHQVLSGGALETCRRPSVQPATTTGALLPHKRPPNERSPSMLISLVKEAARHSLQFIARARAEQAQTSIVVLRGEIRPPASAPCSTHVATHAVKNALRRYGGGAGMTSSAESGLATAFRRLWSEPQG